ncbi:MAG: hypothetical protein IPL53_14630 [Ignavibacteria bacterium]|nr:hypothetical protein [Ignavibacteria bacterium]
MIFKITDEGDDLQNSILSAMKDATIGDTDQKLFTTATTAGLIVFFCFCSSVFVDRSHSKKGNRQLENPRSSGCDIYCNCLCTFICNSEWIKSYWHTIDL